MSDTVEEIKNRLSIVDVIAPYVKLTRAGKYHKGLCPFHKEKTSSFMVSGDRGFYHCFGCGKGGDMFTFVEEMEGVDFRGALKQLADKAGVTITNERPESRDKKEKLYAVLDDAATFFTQTLSKNLDAKKYLKDRGLSEDTITSWNIGYAPSAWRDTLTYLTEGGHDEALVEASGLVKRPDKENSEPPHDAKSRGLYDRFRGRVMFPIRDVSGRIVGFSGRLFPDTGQEAAKYINSPETMLFDKSRVLYGLDVARNGIRKYTFAILVEGQFDLILAQQAGYTNAVALSGTAFTQNHAALIKRYTDNLLLAFDGDRAGVAASGRASQIALAVGLNVKIASLPPGEDPADVIKKNPTQWKEAIKSAVHVVDFYITYLKNLGYDDRKYKLEVSRVVLPYVAAIPNAIDRAHFTERVAEAIGVPVNSVNEELKKVTKNSEPSKQHSVQAATQFSHTSEPFLSRGDSIERLLVGLLQSLEDGEHESLRESLDQKLAELLGEARIKELLESPNESRVSVIEGDLFIENHKNDGNLETIIDELIADLRKDLLRVHYRETLIKLKQAEHEGDEQKVNTLLKEVNKLAKEL